MHGGDAQRNLQDEVHIVFLTRSLPAYRLLVTGACCWNSCHSVRCVHLFSHQPIVFSYQGTRAGHWVPEVLSTLESNMLSELWVKYLVSFETKSKKCLKCVINLFLLLLIYSATLHAKITVWY